MIFAGIGDGGFNVVALLHIVSVIAGTGAVFLAPVLSVSARRSPGRGAFDEGPLGNIIAPALLVAGVFGGALVGMSDDIYDFGQSWLAIGGAVWIVSVAAAAFAYPPTFVTLPDLSTKKPALTGVLHLSLAVMLVLMIWKPGI